MKPPKSRRTKKAYDKPQAGEWVQPVRRGYKMACCDCGLVHLMNFRTHQKRVQFAVWRSNRSTAQMRKQEHVMVPREFADELAAQLLKAKGKKSLRVGGYRIHLKVTK